MDRYRRIARLWNWLPHFRAVAETGSLAMASSAVNVTSPALSRTIRLLEEDIGQPLFDRSGRTLTLNPAGELLLKEVRDSMRRVHNCLEQLSSPTPEQVRISACGPLAQLFVYPLLGDFAQEDPTGQLPHIFKLPDSTIGPSLRQGIVDIAITSRPPSESDVNVGKLATLSCSVYGESEGTDALRYVVPTDANDFTETDGWPPGEDREISLRVACLQGAVDAIRHAGLVAFLPDAVGEKHGLVRVSDVPTGQVTLYVIRRTLLPHKGAIDIMAERIHERARVLIETSSYLSEA